MRLRSVKLVAVLALIALPAILLAGLAAVGFFEPASTPPGSGEPPAGRAAAAPDLPATAEPGSGPELEPTVPGPVSGPGEPARRTPSGDPRFRAVLEGRVVDPGGRPLEGATVRLHGFEFFGTPDFFGPGRGTRDARPVAKVRTGEDGWFRFDGLEPENGYWIEVRCPPFAPLVRALDDLRFPDPTDLGELRLESGAILSGRCVTAGGDPVEGARVLAFMAPEGIFARVEGDGADPHEPDATTDERGAFHILGAPLGDVCVEAGKRGFATARSAAVQTAAGAEIEIGDLVLEPGGEVSGRVLDASGRGLEGIHVAAYRRDRDRGPVAEGGLGGESRTDSAGRFTLTGLRPGLVEVTASSPEWGRISANVVTGQPSVELRFPVRKPVVVRGRVVERGRGSPISGALVWLMRAPTPAQAPSRPPDGTTDADGRFEIETAPTWQHTVIVAIADGFAAARSAPVSLALRALEEPQPPEILLHLDRGAVLAGRVTAAADGSPLAGAVVIVRRPEWITATPLGPETRGHDSVSTLARAVADDEGRFRFEGVSSRTVEIEARCRGYARQRLDAIEVTPGEERTDLVVALGRGGTLSGHVRYTDGGPAAAAWIWLVDGRGVVRTGRQAGADGSYRFERLAAGAYAVRVVAPGRPASERVVTATYLGRAPEATGESMLLVSEGADLAREFTIERGVRVEGVVRAGGAPLSDVQVTLRPRVARRARTAVRATAGDEQARTGRTGAEGRYIIENVVPGAYEVAVRVREKSRESYDVLNRVVRVPRTDRFTADFDVPTGAIHGRVRLPAGAPQAADARHVLQLRSTDGLAGGVRTTRSRPDGSYRFSHLAPGTYEVMVLGSRDWAPVSRGDLVVGPGAVIGGIDLQLEAGVAVEGVVVDEKGEPVADARVRAEPETGGAAAGRPPARGRTDASGRFTVRRLLPGVYGFRAMKLRRYSETVRVVVSPDGSARVRLVLDRGLR